MEKPPREIHCRQCGWRDREDQAVFKHEDDLEPWRCPECDSPVVRLPLRQKGWTH